jgi:uncharacterized protein (TIGR02453 family)
MVTTKKATARTTAAATATTTATEVNTDDQFTGFPKQMYDFWDRLDDDNSKAFFHANKPQWLSTVKIPMERMLLGLRTEFGPAHVFRPNRDIRFATDKRPYKDHHGAVVIDDGGAVRYVSVDGAGLIAAAGMYEMSSDQLARYRAAVADARSGSVLTGIVSNALNGGLTVGEVSLVRVPKPWTSEHPREVLLRHKRLIVSRTFKQPAWLHRVEAQTKVREIWREATPLCEWLAEHVGPSQTSTKR